MEFETIDFPRVREHIVLEPFGWDGGRGGGRERGGLVPFLGQMRDMDREKIINPLLTEMLGKILKQVDPEILAMHWNFWNRYFLSCGSPGKMKDHGHAL